MQFNSRHIRVHFSLSFQTWCPAVREIEKKTHCISLFNYFFLDGLFKTPYMRSEVFLEEEKHIFLSIAGGFIV